MKKPGMLLLKEKTSIDKWQEKVRRFQKTKKGWSRNIEADLRRLKKDLMEEYDSLDIKAENEALSDSELARMREIHLEMQKLWLKDEIKAKQCYRDRDIKEGDKIHILLSRCRKLEKEENFDSFARWTKWTNL
jgi:uncharacterized protein YdcH (DUF465 family)